MKPSSRILRLALLLCCAVAGLASSARADVKIKSKSTSGGQTTESVTYIKGKRQRSEYGSAVSITQCDLRRSLQLVVPAKTYTVTPFGGDDAAGGAASSTKAAAGRPAGATRGGVVTSTYTSTDTGERKQMFGYTARRIKTAIVTEPSPDACNQGKSRMESDGWYIDAAFALDCNVQASGVYASHTAADGCRDQYRTRQLGGAKMGYPVMVTTTIFDDAGRPSFTFTQEVVEISKAVLDASLFDVPAGFREVSDAQALYGAPAAPSSDDEGGADGDESAGDGPNVAASRAAATPVAGPKRAGVVRVGVAVTRAAAAGNLSAGSLAEALREGFAGRLAGPAVEVMPLTSELPQQIEEEAQRKGCDFVLYTAATHKKGGGGGGGFGGFLKKAAPVISGGGDGESSGGANGFKSKDELTLEYTLQRTGASTLAASATLKAKARSDGEDLVEQLVTQAAPAVAAELKK